MRLVAVALIACAFAACDTRGTRTRANSRISSPSKNQPKQREEKGEPSGRPKPSPSDALASHATYPKVLLLAYAAFEKKGNASVPGPAQLEILYRKEGAWKAEVIRDPESNVFHKALAFGRGGETPAILTLGGMAAALKLWRKTSNGFVGETLWQEDFGGRFSRMRDAEVGDLFGDGQRSIAVGTHDQGVVAILRPQRRGGYKVERLDRRANTFIHEIEIADLDRDGRPEIYATPSEPNKLEGGARRGEVVRYLPGKAGDRKVIADLGNRHAKEIYAGDVDGDGSDELYVSVEALTEGHEPDVRIKEPVEIRRFDPGTASGAKVTIATLPDRLCRFLTVGDIDGDGKKEMVAAGFRSGLWLLRPGKNPRGEWGIENIDRSSSGFEHAALLTDLDGDGRDELYVAADDQGELRRYVWNAGRPRREVLRRRSDPRSLLTWNITAAPATVLELHSN